MKHLQTEIIIEQSIFKVWDVLMDFQAYPEWNPFIRSIKGLKQVDKQLQVDIRTLKGRNMRFEPIVLKYEKNDEFRWKGKLGIRGIFDGEHYFMVEERGAQQTRFVHGEFFSGLLVGIMGALLKDTEKSFEEMNKALKLKCESLT